MKLVGRVWVPADTGPSCSISSISGHVAGFHCPCPLTQLVSMQTACVRVPCCSAVWAVLKVLGLQARAWVPSGVYRIPHYALQIVA